MVLLIEIRFGPHAGGGALKGDQKQRKGGLSFTQFKKEEE